MEKKKIDFNSLFEENYKNKKILVSGCAGFIGSHIVEELLNLGAKVIGIDNFYNGHKDHIKLFSGSENFTFFQADIRDFSFMIKLLKDIDVVFHEGAFVSVPQSIEMPELCFDINIKGTFNLLNAARISNVKRFVFASSASIYGDDPILPKKESNLPAPNTPYAASKMSAENLIHSFHESYNMETVILRYFNVYGPRQHNSPYSGVLSIFTENLLYFNKKPVIFGDGSQTRDFIYVKDVVLANLLAGIHSAAPGNVYNVATGNSIDLLSITKILLQLTNHNEDEIVFKERRDGDILHSSADITRISNDLGFKPVYDIKSGLEEYLLSLTK